MTDKEIEKALFANYDKQICEWLDCYGVLAYINRLKANIESAVQSFIRMEMLYKVKCSELEMAEAKIQANLEAAYKHNTEECKRCMDKVEFKHRCAEDALKEQIRKETAKEILQVLYEDAMRYGKTTDGIKHMAHKYGVEVD